MRRYFLKKVFSLGLCLLICITTVVIYPKINVMASGLTYYVDSVNGEDTNDGKNPSTAWKKLEKVNNTTFEAGDKILFKTGCAWNGQLYPKGSGEDGNPIIIDMYGTGNKPIINGNGIENVVYLYNQQYWEINNLEITNTASTEGLRRAICISGNNIGVINHVYIKDCYIHDVTGIMSDKSSGGIMYIAGGNNPPSLFNDLLIEGNYLKNIERSGITVAYASKGSTNVVIRGNMLDTIAGDGIGPASCKSPLIEYNVAKECNHKYVLGEYSAAIWPFACDDAVFQYNEAYLTRHTNDGQAFDCDYLNNGTIYQYNYSHDNEGGFMLICSIPNAPDYQSYNRNSIIRYNISQNDKARIFQVHSRGTMGTQIYNNTIYIGSGLSPKIYDFDLFRKPRAVYSYNNIFYNDGNGWYQWGLQGYHIFEHNAFYGHHPSSEPYDPYKITGDPKLSAQGTGAIGINTVDGYKLLSGSSCINTGKYIGNNGGQDYWGNPLYNGAPDIGANEYSDEVYSGYVPPNEGLKVGHNVIGMGENQVNYSGIWDSDSVNHWSNDSNAYYEVKFIGNKLKIHGSKDPNHGIMAVSIDGSNETLTDCYSANRYDTVLYESEILNNGQHTLKVRVTGDKNNSSNNSYINLICIETYPKPRTVLSYNAGARENMIDYNGNWYSGDYDSWSNQAGAYYKMKFKGIRIKVYGAKDIGHGIMAVSIDGGLEEIVDLYAPERQSNCLLYTSDMLNETEHTIKVRVTGDKNDNANNSNISIEKLIFVPVAD